MVARSSRGATGCCLGGALGLGGEPPIAAGGLGGGLPISNGGCGLGSPIVGQGITVFLFVSNVLYPLDLLMQVTIGFADVFLYFCIAGLMECTRISDVIF